MGFRWLLQTLEAFVDILLTIIDRSPSTSPLQCIKVAVGSSGQPIAGTFEHHML